MTKLEMLEELEKELEKRTEDLKKARTQERIDTINQDISNIIDTIYDLEKE